MLDFSKYKFIRCKDKNDKDTIIALSTYAGKPVRGYAKCDPQDEWSEEKGQRISAARCNQKVALKRLKNAQKKFAEAQKKAEEAFAYLNAMGAYVMDASRAAEVAEAIVDEVLKDM